MEFETTRGGGAMSELKFEGCKTVNEDDVWLTFTCGCGEEFDMEPSSIFGMCNDCATHYSWKELGAAINAAVGREDEATTNR